ncbi:MAG: DNA gyrase inhibitor YacG [Alphaproteobacteria bacterium]|nr:DNA gyrase inhibitor YacG [Alphaproteobacteria bacterium]
MSKKASKCPICGKKEAPEHRPFCSQHCSRVDLGRWLGQGYRIQSVETDEEESSLPRPSEEGEAE